MIQIFSYQISKYLFQFNYICLSYAKLGVKFSHYHQDVIVELIMKFPSKYKHV